MRTLILGLPLPNADFDNYSLLSAPSLNEYSHLVVDIGASARAVDDVIGGTGVHTTFTGQALVNGPASSYAFNLAAMLGMRAREMQQVLVNGGLLVCIAFPQATHVLAEDDIRLSYDWIPRAEGFSYADDLLPAFGRPGAVLVDADHAFAPYVEQLAQRIAYRAYVNEDAQLLREQGSVFARSPSGQAIAFDMPLLEGRVVMLPSLLKPEADRIATAKILTECLKRWEEQQAPEPNAPETDASETAEETV